MDFTPYFGENGLFKPTENTTKKEKKMNDPIKALLDMFKTSAVKVSPDGSTIRVMFNDGTTFRDLDAALRSCKAVRFPEVKRVQFNLKTTDYKRDLDAEPRTIVVKGQKKVVYPYAKDADGKKIQIDIDPVLATIVYFADGTKVVVTNSETDKVDLVDVKMDDGTVVKTASNQAKERAIIYAPVKRLYGTPDQLGNIENVGLARRLTEIVQDGYDTRIEDAKNRIAEAARKAAAAKVQKPARKRYSINETLARINALLDRAESGDQKAIDLLKAINA